MCLKNLETIAKTIVDYIRLLGPSHYLSAAALSWDAMLNITIVDSELISDADMYLFFEKDMRIRVSYIPKRCNKSDNSCLKSYDPKQESKHIIYPCANNLYGYAMSKFPSTSSSKWMDAKNFDWNKYSSNSSKGCVSDKEEYVLLHQRLQLYLRPGLKLKKYTVYLSSINCNGI